MNREEVIWASGVFEGEGCFYINENPLYGARPRPRATVSMTDEDVIRRLSQATGLGRVNGPYQHSRSDTYKCFWNWTVTGFEDVQALVAMLWPGLGERRREKAVEVLRRTPVTTRRKRRVN